MSTSCQECTLLMLSLLLAWTICLTNSQFAGDVTVMMPCFPCLSSADVSVVVLLIVFRLMGYFGVYRIRLCVNHVRLCVLQIRFYGLWQILSRTWMTDVDDSQGKWISKCNKDAYPTQKLKKCIIYIYICYHVYTGQDIIWSFMVVILGFMFVITGFMDSDKCHLAYLWLISMIDFENV